MITRSPTINVKESGYIFPLTPPKESIFLEPDVMTENEYEVQDESYHYLLNTKFDDLNLNNSSIISFFYF